MYPVFFLLKILSPFFYLHFIQIPICRNDSIVLLYTNTFVYYLYLFVHAAQPHDKHYRQCLFHLYTDFLLAEYTQGLWILPLPLRKTIFQKESTLKDHPAVMFFLIPEDLTDPNLFRNKQP